MKKYMYIVFSLCLIITVCIFSSCSNSKNASREENRLNNYEVITSETNKTTVNSGVSKYPEIEKIIVTHYGDTEEYTEKEHSFDFVDKIKTCNDVPNTKMKSNIGDIKIKYKNSKKSKKFANLYLGDDGKIYAKYVDSQNKNYAYLINP